MTIQQTGNSYKVMIAILEAQLKEFKENCGTMPNSYQIANREDLVEHYKNKLEELKRPYVKCSLLGENLLTEPFDLITSNSATEGLINHLENQIKAFKMQISDKEKCRIINEKNYKPVPDFAKEKTENKFLQLDPSRSDIKAKRELLVIDINYLLPEYKAEKPDDLQELLEEKYNRDVLLIDSSRANTLGGIVSGTPAYII